MSEYNDKTRLIGTGSFGWQASERISNRYGTFQLTPTIRRAKIDQLCGKRGKITAVVLRNHRQLHIGDLFLGIYPVLPKVGERIVIGEGILVVDEELTKSSGSICIGAMPEDKENTPWLNVKNLYRAIDQLVEIYFEEE